MIDVVHNYHVWGWKLRSKFNFITIPFIFANCAFFLDHIKENADVSKGNGYFKGIFYIFRKYMPEAISAPNLAALHSTSQELSMRGFFTPQPK